MQEIIKEWNRERKANKKNWVFFHTNFNDVDIAIKSYNTWIQIIKFNNVKDSGPSDCSVKKVNDYLESILKGLK